MSYYGGPVLANIEITTVYVGINVKQANGQIVLQDPRARKGVTWLFECFVADIVNSAYLDVIGQELVDPQAPQIGRGTWKGSQFLVLPRTLAAPTGPVTVGDFTVQVNDDDFDGLLNAATADGRLPQPNPNTHFMVVHSSNVVNSTAFQGSAAAYHRYFTTPSGIDVSYSVFPDGYANTVVVTHELAESISDPGRSLGWGEICDPCENVANQTVVFRGVQVATFLSPLQNKCVGPVDEGQGVLGVDVRIHISGTPDCAGFIVEGSKLSFTVTASRNGSPVVLSKEEWLYQQSPSGYQSFVGPVLSLVASLGGIRVSVTVTFASDGCYGWSKEIHVGVISQDEAGMHRRICKIRDELANYDRYWRLRPNPWNPSRDFLSNPITLEEIEVTRKFAQHLLKWTEAFENVPGIPQRVLSGYKAGSELAEMTAKRKFKQ